MAKDLARRERQIMDILYRLGPASAADGMEELSGTPNYSPVRTQLRVLEGKGHLRHEETGQRFVYHPAGPRMASADAIAQGFREAVDAVHAAASRRRRGNADDVPRCGSIGDAAARHRVAPRVDMDRRSGRRVRDPRHRTPASHLDRASDA